MESGAQVVATGALEHGQVPFYLHPSVTRTAPGMLASTGSFLLEPIFSLFSCKVQLPLVVPRGSRGSKAHTSAASEQEQRLLACPVTRLPGVKHKSEA